MSYLFSSTDQLIDSIYSIQLVNVSIPGETVVAWPSGPSAISSNIDGVELFAMEPDIYRLRFHDRLNSGRGEPEDASVIIEQVTKLAPGSQNENVKPLFTWPIEYIRRYGSETKNIFLLELGSRCEGFPNRVLRFDTRPTKSSSLESDFAAMVKKVLKHMDPSSQAKAKKQQSNLGGVAALFAARQKSHFIKNAVACEYAELAPPSKPAENSTAGSGKNVTNSEYAVVTVKQQ